MYIYLFFKNRSLRKAFLHVSHNMSHNKLTLCSVTIYIQWLINIARVIKFNKSIELNKTKLFKSEIQH